MREYIFVTYWLYGGIGATSPNFLLSFHHLIMYIMKKESNPIKDCFLKPMMRLFNFIKTHQVAWQPRS